MEVSTERARPAGITVERRAEIEAMGEVGISEAAEYLVMSPGTLYNLLWKARQPGQSQLAPKTQGGGGRGLRLRFLVSELKAWRKLSGR